MRRIDWYFDVISPFSYMCLQRLPELPPTVVYRPVLFGAILNHWDHKGPAELAPKRRYTYRWCQWLADSLGVPLKFPASHPFNSLHYMRLIVAAGATEAALRRVFGALWTSGADPSDPEYFRALCRELNVEPDVLSAPAIKDTLRANTQEAIGRGVFGVPTFVVDEEIFWGFDSIDFLKAYLADPAILRTEEIRRLDALPISAARKLLKDARQS